LFRVSVSKCDDGPLIAANNTTFEYRKFYYFWNPTLLFRNPNNFVGNSE